MLFPQQGQAAPQRASQQDDDPVKSAAKAVVTAATAAWMMRFPGHARDDITAQVIFLNGGAAPASA